MRQLKPHQVRGRIHVMVANGSFIGKRFEFKYLLTPIQAAHVEAYINSVGLSRDPYALRPYRVNSLYFDTPILNDYRDKDGSFLRRKKMRARTYAEHWHTTPDNIWLEIKRKHNMNINKSRVPITPTTWEALIDPNTTFDQLQFVGNEADTKVFREFLFYYYRQLYRPHVIIKYFRTAYMSQFTERIRVTFDKNVVACSANSIHTKELAVPVTHNMVIMEVKFNQKLPWWFSEMIRRFELSRTDFSKYRNGIAVLRGHYRIPINK